MELNLSETTVHFSIPETLSELQRLANDKLTKRVRTLIIDGLIK